MGAISGFLGSKLARFLSSPLPNYKQFSSLTIQQLKDTLQPGDLLLVEGDTRISVAIKYLTQSTWSHVAIYIGDRSGFEPLLEADLNDGVITVPLSKYEGFNLRICRPVDLTETDRENLLKYCIDRMGYTYDTKNIFDLMRYLLPTPPVPSRYRRKLIALGSGDPTKAICSTLVAQAFQSIKYPILPRAVDASMGNQELTSENSLLEKRHYSHFTPRDFDLSPYFRVVKPTIEAKFSYKKLRWND